MQDDRDIRRRENDLAIYLAGAHERIEALCDAMGVPGTPTLARIRAALGALVQPDDDGAFPRGTCYTLIMAASASLWYGISLVLS